jgi:ParB family chromosome partitioning protein
MAGLKGAPTRRVASAIDILTQDCDSVVGGVLFKELPIKQIQPYHDHRFRLYKGQRLEDMVESIKEHGVLNPVIVLRLDAIHYEMLAGHNRCHAAGLAGLEKIPALVKENLTEQEALAYVIETNLMQRSFTDMLPSEQAAVLEIRYKALLSEHSRTAIKQEVCILENGDSSESLLETRNRTDAKVGDEYGLSHASVARLLRLNFLIASFRTLVDDGKLSLYAAVDLSYLIPEAQQWVWEAAKEFRYPLTMKNVAVFKRQKDTLTREVVYALIQSTLSEKKPAKHIRKVGVSKDLYDQFFKGKDETEVQSVIDMAVQAWFNTSLTKHK